MGRVDTLLGKPVAPPLGAWLLGVMAFTIIGAERLFAAPHAAFVYARVTAYVSAVTIVALTVVLTALFGIGVGAMLRWLEGRGAARRVVVCTGRSFWTVVAYTWIALILLLVDPPAALAVAELAQPETAELAIRDVLAYRWLAVTRPVVVGCFLVVMVYLLRRDAPLVSAVIAVAFGAGLVAALLTVLQMLGAGGDF